MPCRTTTSVTPQQQQLECADVSEHLLSLSHVWKLQTFELFYCELKIRFPITAEMLLDIRDLIQRKHRDAAEAFNIELLRVVSSCDL